MSMFGLGSLLCETLSVSSVSAIMPLVVIFGSDTHEFNVTSGSGNITFTLFNCQTLGTLN